MSRFGILVDVDKCIGCMACFVACKEENKVAPNIQWNQIHRTENAKERIINYFRVSCMHCDEPACLPVCPVKAIHKGPAGEVLVDPAKCIGCGACRAACPWSVPQFNKAGRTNYFDKAPLAAAPLEEWQKRPAGKAERCTLCVHRTGKGMPPKCVEVCPTGCLSFVDWDSLDPKLKDRAAKSVALGGHEERKPKVRFLATHGKPEALKDKMVQPG